MSDYTGNAHKCLMDKLVVDDTPSTSVKIKVTPIDVSFMLPSETPNDEFHDAEGDDANTSYEDLLSDKVNKMMGSLKGNKLKMFKLLMDVVGKHTATIKDLETLLAEEKENYFGKELASEMSKLVELNTSLSKDVELLTMSLKTEEDELTILKKSLETHKLAHIKTLTKIT